jgi:hypothetical protein
MLGLVFGSDNDTKALFTFGYCWIVDRLKIYALSVE